jgi:ABC-type polysaccharide/polyol phosphate transport system ATPase subunit
MFSIAVHAEADIFLMDEFFGGVGDEKFRKKSEKVFEESVIKGRTIIHVSHSLGTIKKHCDRVLVLNKGEAVFIGSPDEAIEIYKNLQSK